MNGTHFYEPPMTEMKRGKNWLQRLLSQDRRSADRHLKPRLVAYYWDGAAPVPHEIRDISLNGMYLLTTERWYPGTLVMITLQRTDSSAYARDARSIAVQAKVVRWGPDGVGFKLIFPENEDYNYVRGLLDAADQKTFSEFVWRYRQNGAYPQRRLKEAS